MRTFRVAASAAGSARYEVNKGNAIWLYCDALLGTELPEGEVRRLLEVAEQTSRKRRPGGGARAPGILAVALAWARMGVADRAVMLAREFPVECRGPEGLARVARLLVPRGLQGPARTLVQEAVEAFWDTADAPGQRYGLHPLAEPSARRRSWMAQKPAWRSCGSCWISSRMPPKPSSSSWPWSTPGTRRRHCRPAWLRCWTRIARPLRTWCPAARSGSA